MSRRITARRALACLMLAALPMAIRLGALWRKEIPQPVWDDEFSYLLGADTFASGRLANPPHPMWVHFETFHVNWLPTYVTKFPPAQSLFLAFGQKVLGHPWYGTWISFGLMCAALCWMLQAWMPSVFAALGTVLGMAQVGIFGYWMDSYCGGAVSAMGGCLVVGAVARLCRAVDWRSASLGSIGLMLLANSRPFEGLVTTVAALLALFWWRNKTGLGLGRLFTAQTLVPLVVICGSVFLWMGYYNYRTTENPFAMPYSINSKMYEANPQFWILPEKPAPVYRHEVIKNIWTVWTRDHWVRARHNPLVVVPLLLSAGDFFSRPLTGLAILTGLLISSSRKIWIAMAIFAALFCALLLEVGFAPHYYAPAIFLPLVAATYSLRRLYIAGRRFGAALVLLFMAFALIDGLRPDTFHQWREMPSRREAIAELTAHGGRHVVFVRYAPEHKMVMIDQVYNRADIDGSNIVFARYMGEARDKELIDYYPARKAWILDADEQPMALEPYPTAGVGN